VAPGDPWPYRCSIVIPTYNRVEVAEECLVSVGDHSADGTYEVVVVDNASSDGMPSLLDLLDGDVQVIRNPVNRGFAVASNQGAATARGEYLVFLNADIIAGPGWLDPLLRRLDGDSSIGAVGARLLYPDGRLQHGGVWLLETPYPGEPLRAVHRWYQGPGDRVEALQAGPVTAVTAAVMAVRRAAWEQVGGFDEGYWNGYEDVDLCLRLRAAGWTVCYEPASTLVHAESVSGPERFSAAAANIVRLQRWQPLVRPDGRIDRDGRVQLHRAASPRRNTR
jgi:GT2 family glycosyltransferase